MLRGILPVIPTLFTDDNVIDPESMRAVVRFALDSGAHGIVFPGVASEYSLLSIAERSELMTMVHEEVGGRVPIVGGASAATSDEVIIAGGHALEHGINHLMIMAPAGLGTDLDQHHAFFDRVTSALKDAQVMLQNAPSPIGAGLDAQSIIAIAAANSSIAYAKEETLPSGPAITAIAAASVPHLRGVLGGGGARYLIDELNRGAVGAIPAVELTDLHVAIYNAHMADEKQKARELYRMSLPMLVAQSIYRMRLTKYVLKQRGLADRLHVRADLPELDAFSRQDIDAMLKDLRAVLT